LEGSTVTVRLGWPGWHRSHPSWQARFAVRRDWPDGTHDYVELCGTEARAGWAAMSNRMYWRRSHFRPSCSVVQISRRDYDLHHGRRQMCRAPDCPVDADRVSVELQQVWR
jgi:hypothetical protein